MEKLTTTLPVEDVADPQAEIAQLEAMYEAPAATQPASAPEQQPGHASILGQSELKSFGHRLNLTPEQKDNIENAGHHLHMSHEQKLRTGRAITLLAATALMGVINNQGAVEVAYQAVTGHDTQVVQHEDKASTARRTEMEVDFYEMVKDMNEANGIPEDAPAVPEPPRNDPAQLPSSVRPFGAKKITFTSEQVEALAAASKHEQPPLAA